MSTIIEKWFFTYWDLLLRYVGSIFILKRLQNCKRRIDWKERFLITKWKYKHWKYIHIQSLPLLNESDERCAWITLRIAIHSNKAIEFYQKVTSYCLLSDYKTCIIQLREKGRGFWSLSTSHSGRIDAEYSEIQNFFLRIVFFSWDLCIENLLIKI